jgi:N-acetylmuramoyl-L-alanine amidase
MLSTPVHKDFIPQGRRNRPGRIMTPEYVTIHNTGDPGVTVKQYIQYLKGHDAESRPVSWHFTVDDVGLGWHLPLSETAYHAGDGAGPGNRKSIGIEICEVPNREAAELNAAKVVAWLLMFLGLDVIQVVPHKHWTATECPKILWPRWDEFIARVTLEKYALEGSLGVAPWDPSLEIESLRKNGLIDSSHSPEDKVTWGEFATVLNRLTLLSHVK